MQGQIAAMRTRNVARNRKAQPDAARLQIAPFIKTMKRAKSLLAARFGNTGSIIVNGNIDKAFARAQRYLRRRAMFQRIVDQIVDAAAQCIAAHRQFYTARCANHDALFGDIAPAPCRSGRLAYDCAQIDALRIFAAFTARKIQIFIKHALHFGDVTLQGSKFFAFWHHRQFQFQPRQRCFQIMAHTGQHFGALGDMALNARAHGQKCLCRAAHLGGAIGFEIVHAAPLAKTFGGKGQTLDRAYLIAQKQNGHGQKHK